MLSNGFDAASRNLIDVVVDVTAVLAVGASAVEIGMLNAAGTLAFFLLGAPIGVIVDRTEARVVMMWAATVRAGVCVATAALLATGHLSFWLLATASFMIGVTGTASETGQMVRATQVVGRGGVGRLVARLQSADTALALVVPAAAGLVLAAMDAAPLMVVAAVTAVAAAVFLAGRDGTSAPTETTPSGDRPPPGVRAGVRRFADDVVHGLAAFRTDPVVRRLTWSSTCTNLGLAVFSSVEAIFLLRTLDIGTSVYGALVTAGAAGGLVGSLVAERVVSGVSRSQVVWAASACLTVVSALPLTALAVAGWALPLLTAHAVTWGICIVVVNVQTSAIVAARTEPGVLGRVSALRRAITYGVVPVGSIAGGLSADHLGITTVLGAAVVVAALSTVFAWRAARADEDDRTRT
ncbi:MFS transporter [Isoptericola sp. b515]|uniref:MFS transporter n=1 Tax=Isoptericola sp. b515 TaxID=3064652 RepID=UPI0027122B80|nr:MFS transporter [Isoptericola sp. b515]MDO8148452.1 MFS transporter [Isoptericola sp. b515]